MSYRAFALRRTFFARKKMDAAACALCLLAANPSVPREAQLRVAEAFPACRSLVFPLRGRRDVALIFSGGLLGLLEEAARRGELSGEAWRESAGLSADLAEALVGGHFRLADWWVRREPKRMNGEFLLSVAARLRAESAREMAAARLGAWVCVYDWLESHLDMAQWDFSLRSTLVGVSVCFATDARGPSLKRSRLEQLFGVAAEKARQIEAGLARLQPGGVFLVKTPFFFRPRQVAPEVLLVRFRRSPADPRAVEAKFAVQMGLFVPLETALASLLRPGSSVGAGWRVAEPRACGEEPRACGEEPEAPSPFAPTRESEGRCVDVALRFKLRARASEGLARAALAELRASAARFGPLRVNWSWASEEGPAVLDARLCFAGPRDAARALREGFLDGLTVGGKLAEARLVSSS
jgi:hypothetical protein